MAAQCAAMVVEAAMVDMVQATALVLEMTLGTEQAPNPARASVAVRSWTRMEAHSMQVNRCGLARVNKLRRGVLPMSLPFKPRIVVGSVSRIAPKRAVPPLDQQTMIPSGVVP
jgi:hypothetical protein